VDRVILGAVIDVRHLADVKLLLLVVVERLEQLAPARAPAKVTLLDSLSMEKSNMLRVILSCARRLHDFL